MFGIHLLPSNHWQNFGVLLEWTPPKSGKQICQFGWSNWSNPFRCCLENSRFFHPCLWTAKAPSTRTAGRCCLSRPKISPWRFGSMFCRWDADRRLCGGHHGMCTRTTMGRDLKQLTNRCTFFCFFFQMIFFSKMDQIDFGYFCQNINFGLHFFLLFWKMSFWGHLFGSLVPSIGSELGISAGWKCCR